MATIAQEQGTSVVYGNIRARQLEGTFPGDPKSGVWPISVERIAYGWGRVAESDWPYETRERGWPPPEPPGLDQKAKSRRTACYQRVWSAGQCCHLLGQMRPVSVAVEITQQWFNAEHGIIHTPSSDEKIVGSHSVLLVGFDLSLRAFHFVNSWGDEWGQRGFGYLPVDYVDQFLISSWAEQLNEERHGTVAQADIAPLRWQERSLLAGTPGAGDTVYCQEVYDAAQDERMGWAFAVRWCQESIAAHSFGEDFAGGSVVKSSAGAFIE